MTVKQISIFLENHPGKLAEFTKLLSDNQINLRAITVAEASDFGIIRIIVDDVVNATTVIRDADYICSVTDVLAVEIKDEPGALANMITVLGENDVNIEYMYALANSKKNAVYMMLRVADATKAVQVLEKSGLRTVRQDALI